MDKLTDKQEIFVQELIKGKSQRQAYKTAYPRSVKWKDAAVDSTASDLLSEQKNPKVFQRYKELHDRLMQEANDECIVSAKEVLREIKSIAFADPEEVRPSDRLKALELLGKHLILFTDKLEISKPKGEMADEIEQELNALERERESGASAAD